MKNNQSQANHLKGEASPYLLQHLYNPVDWYPWGEEALKKAVREEKPLLVSVGYSACHWCHVMEKESFEDDGVAEIMNNNFICIKVDREERPDIDHMYMTAVQLLGGRGGWPLNCFALPDTRPFWGATYFPRQQWIYVLEQVIELYNTRKDELVTQSENLIRGIAGSSFVEPSALDAAFQKSDSDEVFRGIMKQMDQKEGGAAGAPKFPLPVNLEFLLHYYNCTGHEGALQQVELTLEKMAMGGIYDQVGGGFARYSTDEIWKVPHFEKMLYDNGQLVSAYSSAWKVLGNPVFRDVVYQTIEFVGRELTTPDDTFWSALDADSEGREGKFYVWREEEIDEVLGSDSPLVKEYFQVGKKGLWEDGDNILVRNGKDEDFCRLMNISPEALRRLIENARHRMLLARSRRVRPGLDHKVLTSWNALMIKGLTDAGAAFSEGRFLSMADKAARFITENHMTPEGKLLRMKGDGRSIDGFLEDYAMFIQALIRLWEVSMEEIWLMKAYTLAEYVMRYFSSSSTRLFNFSSSESENLRADYYDINDNVIPSSNSVMAINLLYLANYFERTDWVNRSLLMLSDISPRLLAHGTGYSNWGRLLLYNTYSLTTMVICGPEATDNINKVNSKYLPGVLVAGSLDKESEIPVFQNRFRGEKTLFYACNMAGCKEPADNLDAALSLLD